MRIPVKSFVWLALMVTAGNFSQGAAAASSTTPRTQNAMPGMDMGDARGDAEQTREAAKSVNDSMTDHDMHMGAHMFMTDLRPPNSADAQRAAANRGNSSQINSKYQRLQNGACGRIPDLHAQFAPAAIPLHELRVRI